MAKELKSPVYQSLIEGKTRKQIGTKVSAIRKKPEAKRTAAEKALLADWEQPKASGAERTPPGADSSKSKSHSDETKPRTSPTPPRKSLGASPRPTTGGGSKAENDQGERPKERVKASAGDKAKAKPPPKVRETSKGGDWREKWGGERLGREGTCVFLASQMTALMKWMHDDIVKNGGRPAFTQEFIQREYNSVCVLAWDDVLPPHFEMTPTVMAVGGFSASATQTFIARRRAAKTRGRETPADKDAKKYGGPRVAEEVKKERQPDPEPDPMSSGHVDQHREGPRDNHHDGVG